MTAQLNQDSLSTKQIRVDGDFKAGLNKITSRLRIGDETYVLKAGSGYTEMEDHVSNSDLFNRLAIPGVRAPLAQALSPGLRQAVKQQLPAAAQLRTHIDTPAMISTVAPGLTVETILSAALHGRQQELLEKIGSAKDSEAAVSALSDVLKVRASRVPTKDKKLVELVDSLKNKNKRRTAMAELMKPNPESPDKFRYFNKPEDLLLLSSIRDLLDAKRPDEVAAQLRRPIAVHEKLVSHINSEAGAFALGAIGAVDLVGGMFDRLVGQFNGANFMFDPDSNDFWSIDNAKLQGRNVNLGLSAPDETDWKRWILGLTRTEKMMSVADHLHDNIYVRKENEDQREFTQSVVTRAAVTDAVAATLGHLHRLVNDGNSGLEPAMRRKLKARLEFLFNQDRLADALNVSEFSTIPALTGRESNESNLDSQYAMNIASNPTTSVEKLNALDDAFKTSNDQRLNASLFVLRFRRLIHSLQEKAHTLARLRESADDPFLRDIQPGVMKTIEATVARWLRTLEEQKEEGAAKELRDAVENFRTEFTNFTARAAGGSAKKAAGVP